METALLGHGVPGDDHGRFNEKEIRRKAVPCWALFTEGHITADGWLAVCPLDDGRRFRVADLDTTSFSTAWHSATLQALRKAHLEKSVGGTACAKCIVYRNERSLGRG